MRGDDANNWKKSKSPWTKDLKRFGSINLLIDLITYKDSLLQKLVSPQSI